MDETKNVPMPDQDGDTMAQPAPSAPMQDEPKPEETPTPETPVEPAAQM